MKICHKRINDAELKWREDKNIGAPGTRRNFAVMVSRQCFQHAHGCGSYRDDTTVLRFRRVDCFGNLFLNVEALMVHRVFFNAFGFHRRKRAETDVQCDEANLDAASANIGEQFICEMQTSRWRGDRSFVARVNGLITGRVL